MFEAVRENYICASLYFNMKQFLRNRISKRQYELLRGLSYEFKRWKCRITTPRLVKTDSTLLHLGSGVRHIKNWFNVDLFESDRNIDIANGKLPFESNHFRAIVSQHVVEHLEIDDELIPLFKECHRILELGGELWISTPDLEKITKSYVEQRNRDMIEDRKKRLPDWNLGGKPSQHFMNDMFYQNGEHKTIFDYDLLSWTLTEAGFTIIDRSDEREFLRRFPEFPERNDDYQSVYLRAVK